MSPSSLRSRFGFIGFIGFIALRSNDPFITNLIFYAMFYLQPVKEPVIQEHAAEVQVTPERDVAAQIGELQIRNIFKHVYWISFR